MKSDKSAANLKRMFTLIAQSAPEHGNMAERRMSLASKLTEERRSRLAAERMLELKKAELFAANRKLGRHAQQLSEEIVETRAEVESIRGENQRVKSDLSAANQRIAITERRLWYSIETIKDGFAFFNGDNEMIMANRAYLNVFDGLEVVKPGVNYITILQVLTDEGIVNTGDLPARAWRKMMTDRLHSTDPDPVIIKLWNGASIKLHDQRGPGGDMVSLGLDITATVAYEKKLKEARAIAESANRAKSAFLANMSHEIRTPMNGVVGMAEVLADTELDAEQQLYVQTIKNSGEALLVIINDVLDYSKIEAKRLDLHPEPFDLERAIQEVLMLLQPSVRDKGLRTALDYDLFLPSQLIGDPGRIRQVLTNLIGNAVKFTAQGHILVRVTGVVDEDAKTAQVHIVIEDTGIGIPADMVDHIFGEFNQVENERNRQFDGTGLGLAISQRLVEMMGGDIWVTSEEGNGSCFGVKLPMVPQAASMAAGFARPADLRNVMIVDDVDIHRTILERQLTQLGLTVTSCASGKEALACFGPEIDLLITDHNMPNMDGFELCAALREQGLPVPILLCSDHPSDALIDPSAPLVQGILPKPLPRAALLDQLTKLYSEPDHGPPAISILPRVMRILAAEDNKTNQLVFRKMIKDLNIDLTFASNGEEAVELFQSIVPDLVFMDISMPKMDGKEATAAIRQLESGTGQRVPIISMTAHAMAGDDRVLIEAGMDHYLTKPLRKPQILEQIEAVWTADLAPLHPPQDDG
jgi:signal transduction histidine kinase/DNA-binding response OmpR family regulator